MSAVRLPWWQLDRPNHDSLFASTAGLVGTGWVDPAAAGAAGCAAPAGRGARRLRHSRGAWIPCGAVRSDPSGNEGIEPMGGDSVGLTDVAARLPALVMDAPVLL